MKNDKPKVVYSIKIDVMENDTFGLTATMPNIHPASLIFVMTSMCQKLSQQIVAQAQKPKIDIVDPTKLPPKMRLHS